MNQRREDKAGHETASMRQGARLQEAVGQSEAFLAFQERLSRAATVDRPVLLVGERGTGKELAAARLHYLSPRWQGPLVALNCAALSPALIESELFGYERGAFTGAEERRTGRFEAAHGGTLFLDEVGSIPLEVQEKILRVVEYSGFERVGSSRTIEVDARIIGATNADLPGMAEDGRFKRDLLDRLSFEVVALPPLRDRQEDIPVLAAHFAARMAVELGRDHVPLFSREAAGALEAYPWPGNIRELKNVVERAVYKTDSPVIEEIVFDPFEASAPAGPTSSKKEPPEPDGKARGVSTDLLMDMPLRKAVRELEIRMLKRALEKARFNQRRAAAALGLTYDQFRGLYRKYSKTMDKEERA